MSCSIAGIKNSWQWVRVTECLLAPDWINQLTAFDRLVVGFSGGLDSTVLLHSLAAYPELRGKLYAVHIHHGLSVNADGWEAHCQQFCAARAIPFITRRVDFPRAANIEEGARTARYQVFSTLIADNDGLLLGHHGDDQAETLLLQLLRGAGVDGMAAMTAVKPLAKGKLLRPFLSHTRQTLETYARLHNLHWIEDESNQDRAFSRNYLRHQVMPLLREKWPGAVTNLMRSADHCQQAKNNLEALALIDCLDLAKKSDTLPMSLLTTLSYARLSNVLRVWLKNNAVRMPSAKVFDRLINEVVFAAIDASPCVQWDNVVIKRYQQTLHLLQKKSISPAVNMEWKNFPEPIQLEIGCLQATVVEGGLQVPVGGRVHVRFRQGGELFHWRGQTKQLKKLLQQWQVPPWQRDILPLIFIDDCLAAVVGFAISDYFYHPTTPSYQIKLRS